MPANVATSEWVATVRSLTLTVQRAALDWPKAASVHEPTGAPNVASVTLTEPAGTPVVDSTVIVRTTGARYGAGFVADEIVVVVADATISWASVAELEPA